MWFIVHILLRCFTDFQLRETSSFISQNAFRVQENGWAFAFEIKLPGQKSRFSPSEIGSANFFVFTLFRASCSTLITPPPLPLCMTCDAPCEQVATAAPARQATLRVRVVVMMLTSVSWATRRVAGTGTAPTCPAHSPAPAIQAKAHGQLSTRRTVWPWLQTIEEKFIQKRRQRSSRMFELQSWFNSLSC